MISTGPVISDQGDVQILEDLGVEERFDIISEVVRRKIGSGHIIQRGESSRRLRVLDDTLKDIRCPSNGR